VAEKKKSGEPLKQGVLTMDREQIADDLLDGFDPEASEMDRRILFELTGLQLDDRLFIDDESSSDDDEDEELALVARAPN